VAVVTAALRSNRDPAALRLGRRSVALLYLGAGAGVNAFFLLRGDDYAKFADGAYIGFVRHTWHTVVVPHHTAWIGLLITFELAVGVLALMEGRRTQLAYGGAIAFHVALLSFGWGFYAWSLPMLAALTTLLRAERRAAARPAEPRGRLAPSRPGPRPMATVPRGAVELFWIPLGAGGRVVRFNGIVYEAVSAAVQRRARRALYHTALSLDLPHGHYMVEMTPVPDRCGRDRGVVVEGPVGSRALARFRVFRYEVRRWRDGIVPDLQYAVGSPVRITDDPATAQRIFDALPHVPPLVWGRDERGTHDMWSCNSVISWTLTAAGVDVDAIAAPPNARAPGWEAGVRLGADANGEGTATAAPAPHRKVG